MDWGYLLAAAVTALGMAGAYRAGRHTRPAPKQPPAYCPCGHAISFHESLTGRCYAKDENSEYTKGGGLRTVYLECTCRHYAGPELINALTMRPLLPIEPPANPES